MNEIKILNINCMDLLNDTLNGYYDLAIVDPPYGIGLDMVNGLGSFETIHKDKDWNDQIPSENYFKKLHDVSKNQIIWGCNYYAKYIPAVGRIVHDKIMSSENTKFNFSHCDLASCSLQKRITIFRYEWSGNRQNGTVNWNNDGQDGRIHPTQKPVALYEWLLKTYAKPNQHILDTHSGSGSLAIAVHNMNTQHGMNLRLTACEIDPEYYQASLNRLQAHQKQLKLI